MGSFEVTLGVAGLFTEKLNKFLGGIADDIKQTLSHSLQLYTQNWYDKISKVKTFIFREGSVDFHSIYFSLLLTRDNNVIAVPENVEELFRSNNYLTILGHAGSGKTMLMRHCFLSILKSQTFIPVIIELRDLNRFEGDFYEYISKFVFNMKLAVNESIMNRLMESGEFVFFFDGYDELSLDSKENRTSQICEFVDRFPNNYYMLTSRPEAEAEALSRFENFHIRPLTKSQIKAFIHQQMTLVSEGTALEEKMIKAIQAEDMNISAYLSNPLLLSMFILTFGNHPTIPSKKSEFYFNVFDTLYTKHDSVTKGGGFAHDKACKLERFQYIKVLQWFCYRTYFKQNYSFSRSLLLAELNSIREKLDYDYDSDKLITDLTVAISILVRDGLDYIFPHRSMQEYFAAQLIASLPEQVRIKNIYENPVFASSRNQNLWSLCQEINEYEFQKNFIAPNLNSLITKIEKALSNKHDSAKSLLEYVIEISHPRLNFDNSHEVRSISHSQIACFDIVFFYSHQDLDMMRILTHWIFTNVTLIHDVLSTKYEKDGNFPLSVLMKEELPLLMPKLLEDGIHEKMYNRYYNLCEVTNALNDSLSNYDSNNAKLLNI